MSAAAKPLPDLRRDAVMINRLPSKPKQQTSEAQLVSFRHDESNHGHLTINGKAYSHQLAVAIFTRDGEDGPVTRQIIPVHGGDLGELPPRMGLWDPKCPSDRRQGLSILFWAEEDGQFYQQEIAQHKGYTLVEMKTAAMKPCPYCTEGAG